MLDVQQVTELANDVARTTLSGRKIESVSVEPSVDWLGHDAVRITVVTHGQVADRSTVEAIVAIENKLQDRFYQLGAELWPFVDILTPEDLAADDGPES